MLTVFSAVALSLSEDLQLGGQVALIGMGTVFLALIIIWGVLSLSGAIFSRKKKSGAKTAQAPAPAAPAPVRQAPAAAQTADPGELVAVLAAAVAAASGMRQSDFRVVSFRRR